MRKLRDWFVAAFQPKAKSSRNRRCKLSIEFLEDRTVPATWTWTGLGDGNWSDDDNWQDSMGQKGVPVAADDVVFSMTHNVASTVDPGFTPNSLNRITIEGGYTQQLTLQKDITVTTTTQEDGIIFGSYNYTVPGGGLYEWSGGTLRGFGSPTSYNTVVNGQMFINAASVTLDGRNIQNFGNIQWFDAAGLNVIDVKNSGRINVKAGGLFETPVGGTFEIKDDGSGRVNNEGELLVSANTDMTYKGEVYTFAGSNWNLKDPSSVRCDGVVVAASGSSLVIEANANMHVDAAATFNSGAMITVSGNLVLLADGAATFGSGIAIIGTGAITVDALSEFGVENGTVTMKPNMTLHLGCTIWLGGTLSFEAASTLRVFGASIQGTAVGAQCVIGAGCEAIFDGLVVINDVNFVNNDTLGWRNGGDITLDGVAKITNNAFFVMDTDKTMGGAGSLINNDRIEAIGQNAKIGCIFANSGTLVLHAGQVTVLHDWDIGAGAVVRFAAGNLQVDGTFTSAGTIEVPIGGTLAADLFVNNGSIDFRNSGTTQTLSITRRVGIMTGGNYTQGASGSLFLEINSNTSIDSLSVAGQAMLGGTLNISLGGAYQPGGDLPRTWMFMTYNVVNGTFGTVNKPANFGNPVYGPISASITWTPPG